MWNKIWVLKVTTGNRQGIGKIVMIYDSKYLEGRVLNCGIGKRNGIGDTAISWPILDCVSPYRLIRK